MKGQDVFLPVLTFFVGLFSGGVGVAMLANWIIQPEIDHQEQRLENDDDAGLRKGKGE